MSLLATGSAFAATGTVMGALGFGASATTMGTLGAAEFDQARLLLERSGSTAGEQLVNTVAPQATQAMVVTEKLIRNTMANAPLQTQQASVSLPVIQNYVDGILQGEVNIPPIKVDGNIIVDGNHRYIASQIAGIEIGIQQWTGARLDKVIEWIKVFIDSVDWGNR